MPAERSLRARGFTLKGERSQTLGRGIQVLEVLARPDAVRGLTVSELSAELGIGRPIIYRLVNTLEEHGLVARRPDGRVRLGLGLRALGAASTPAVAAEAGPVLRRLADECGATAHLTIAEGGLAVALAVVEPSWTDYAVAYRVGSRHPLERGAAGRAILAGRENRWSPTQSAGELEPGAYGLAVGLRGAAGAEASVGLISLEPIDAAHATAALTLAAAALAPLI